MTIQLYKAPATAVTNPADACKTPEKLEGAKVTYIMNAKTGTAGTDANDDPTCTAIKGYKGFWYTGEYVS